MKLIAFSATLLLTACVSNPTLVESAPSTEVRVAVAVPCIALSDIPPVPKSSMSTGGDVHNKAAGAAADVYALEGYAEKTDALLRKCASESTEVKDGPANK